MASAQLLSRLWLSGSLSLLVGCCLRTKRNDLAHTAENSDKGGSLPFLPAQPQGKRKLVPLSYGPARVAGKGVTSLPPEQAGEAFGLDRLLRLSSLAFAPLFASLPRSARGLELLGRIDCLLQEGSLPAPKKERKAVLKLWSRVGWVAQAWFWRVTWTDVPQTQLKRGGWLASALARPTAAESRTYTDILLWAFDDTFFNLTLKEIHFLAWASAYCPNVRFVFKGDADVFMHVGNLLEFLAARDPAQDLLVGDVIVQARPIRARASKYYIPEAVYGLPAYPAYAGGGGFVLSGATLRRLAGACAQVELFPIDDVFLGMCLQRLRLTPEPHPAFRTFGIPQPSAAPHLRTFDPCFYRELVVVHGLSAADIWLMWHLLHGSPGPACAHQRPVAAGPFQWGP
ncbi:hypothetical protein QTO34_010674 [Cnephaeus nilssonii]|uniref:Hexosyltransferase n=1 Tax=Cnephaeus nilssonii TaxID=3371016 RepID=A0AA40HFZ8_CNENI|nr:hypothetical protein QTO34_010674 [Eptesicus nilssonii]